MAEQSKDLAVVHLEIDAIDSMEAIVVDLGQVCDLHVLILELHSGDLGRNGLIVFLLDVL